MLLLKPEPLVPLLPHSGVKRFHVHAFHLARDPLCSEVPRKHVSRFERDVRRAERVFAHEPQAVLRVVQRWPGGNVLGVERESEGAEAVLLVRECDHEEAVVGSEVDVPAVVGRRLPKPFSV